MTDTSHMVGVIKQLQLPKQRNPAIKASGAAATAGRACTAPGAAHPLANYRTCDEHELTKLLLLWAFRCFKDLILQSDCWVATSMAPLLLICWAEEAGPNTGRLLPSSTLSGHTSASKQTNKQTNGQLIYQRHPRIPGTAVIDELCHKKKNNN